MTARMAAIYTTRIWNLDPAFSRRGPLSRKKADAVDVPAADEDDKLLMETKDVRSTDVEMQSMIQESLHVLQETALDCRIEAMIETKVVSVLKTVNHECAECKTQLSIRPLKRSYAELSPEAA